MNNLLNCFSRDALAKEIYSHLFAWLISKVNSNVFKGKQPTSIAILDIFGFEVKSICYYTAQVVFTIFTGSLMLKL